MSDIAGGSESTESPQTDEQAGGRAATHTGAEIDRLRIEAAVLIDDLRTVLALSGKAVTQLRDDLARLRTEAAMLRAEVKQLKARVREWEAVNADLAARCDSGDIPTRLGERYSQAVLREIDRLRAERDALRAVYEPLLAQVTDWHTRLQAMWLPAAMGAVADLREEMGAALGSTPDTADSEGDQP